MLSHDESFCLTLSCSHTQRTALTKRKWLINSCVNEVDGLTGNANHKTIVMTIVLVKYMVTSLLNIPINKSQIFS